MKEEKTKKGRILILGQECNKENKQGAKCIKNDKNI